MSPELKSPEVPMPFRLDSPGRRYAQRLIDDYVRRRGSGVEGSASVFRPGRCAVLDRRMRLSSGPGPYGWTAVIPRIMQRSPPGLSEFEALRCPRGRRHCAADLRRCCAAARIRPASNPPSMRCARGQPGCESYSCDDGLRSGRIETDVLPRRGAFGLRLPSWMRSVANGDVYRIIRRVERRGRCLPASSPTGRRRRPSMTTACAAPTASPPLKSAAGVFLHEGAASLLVVLAVEAGIDQAFHPLDVGARRHRLPKRSAQPSRP